MTKKLLTMIRTMRIDKEKFGTAPERRRAWIVQSQRDRLAFALRVDAAAVAAFDERNYRS